MRAFVAKTWTAYQRFVRRAAERDDLYFTLRSPVVVLQLLFLIFHPGWASLVLLITALLLVLIVSYWCVNLRAHLRLRSLDRFLKEMTGTRFEPVSNTIFPPDELREIYWFLTPHLEKHAINYENVNLFKLAEPAAGKRLAGLAVFHCFRRTFVFLRDDPAMLTTWQKFELLHSFTFAGSMEVRWASEFAGLWQIFAFTIWACLLSRWDARSFLLLCAAILVQFAVQMHWATVPGARIEEDLDSATRADVLSVASLDESEAARVHAVLKRYMIPDSYFPLESNCWLHVRRLAVFDYFCKTGKTPETKRPTQGRSRRIIVNLVTAAVLVRFGPNITTMKLVGLLCGTLIASIVTFLSTIAYYQECDQRAALLASNSGELASPQTVAS